MNEAAKPIGFWDRIIARLMAIAHRTIQARGWCAEPSARRWLSRDRLWSGIFH